MPARPGVRAGAFAIADQVLLSLANLAAGLALARELTPAAFGAYVVAFAVLLIGSSVQVALVTDPLVIFGSPRTGASQARYFAALLRIQIILASSLAVTLGLTAFGLQVAWGQTSEIPIALFGVAIVVIPLQVQWFLRSVFFARLRPATVFWNDLLGAILRLALLAALILSDRLSAFTALLASGLGGLAATAAALPACRDLVIAGAESMKAVWAQHWQYGRWLLATSGAYWCSGQAPALLASIVLSPVAAAVIKACQLIVAPLNVALTGLDGVVAPRASRTCAAEGEEALRRFCRRFAMLAAGGAILYGALMLPFTSSLMEFIYEGRYSGYASIVAVLMLDALLAAAARAPVLRMKVLGETRRIFAAYAWSAAAGLACLALLAPLYGILGAAIAAPVASGVLLLLVFFAPRQVSEPSVEAPIPAIVLPEA